MSTAKVLLNSRVKRAQHRVQKLRQAATQAREEKSLDSFKVGDN